MRFRSWYVLLFALGVEADRLAKMPDEHKDSDTRNGRFGFLGRALDEVKRVGAALDLGGSMEVEKALEGLGPEVRQAADELMKGQEDLFGLAKEAGNLWNEIRGSRGNAEDLEGAVKEEAAKRELEDLARDAGKATRGAIGDIIGDFTTELADTFEDRLTQALSEGNMKAASRLWRRLLESPGGRLLARDRRIWAGAERAVRKYLSSYMSEESALEAERAVNATANFALHFAGRERNNNKRDWEVFQEISGQLCHLQGAALKLWPLASRALPLFGYEEYVTSAEQALRANAIARVTQTVTAGALLGLNPRKDPFLATLIASFAMGHLTKDVAQNLAAFFQKGFAGESSRRNVGEGRETERNTADIVAEIVSGGHTCEELGHQSFLFFESVKRALEDSDTPRDETPRASNDRETYSSRMAPSNLRRPPHKLGIDGWMFRIALWGALAIDQPLVALSSVCVFCALMTLAMLLCLKSRGNRSHKMVTGTKGKLA